jgi:hypothetical protein
MPRWRVDYIGNVLSTLGTVDASDERSTTRGGRQQFNITPARRNKIVVTRLGTQRGHIAYSY